jgi:hypothetical protein
LTKPQQEEATAADASDYWIYLEKLAGDREQALNEVAPTTWNAEQSGNLRYRDAESGTSLETKQDCFADEAGDSTQPQ